MTSQNNLEIKGNLQTNPFAELLAETFAARLTGSFRLSRENEKIVVYLNSGKPVFAASNARRHRLFEILLRENRIDAKHLTEVPNFAKDTEFAEALKSKGVITEGELNKVFSLQIEEILKTVFAWMDGEWIFSPLIRIKENIQYKVEVQKLQLEYARSLPKDKLVRRFKSFNETFGANPAINLNLELQPQEAFFLSRFEKRFLKIEEIKNLSGLPDADVMQALYCLWLGGFLYRENWNAAFSERKISEISSARLALKKEDDSDSPQKAETDPVSKTPSAQTLSGEVLQPAGQQAEEILKELSLEEYLDRAENSASYYEFFGIQSDAELSDVKNAYFTFAKRFHPDKFYQERDSELLQRIQNAFSQTAHAYETLKNEDKRKTYDYRLSKHLAYLKSKEKEKRSAKTERSEIALEAFEQGFDLLMEEEYEEALPFLARAVQLAPEAARYHAYYGKALSNDESQRFKADAELQSAVRLEPQNATFRILLAEFYIQYELLKRAEGELHRLLVIHPNHPEALALLDSLPKK
jgi:curved DNA-binding protein CbpA